MKKPYQLYQIIYLDTSTGYTTPLVELLDYIHTLTRDKVISNDCNRLLNTIDYLNMMFPPEYEFYIEEVNNVT